MISKFVIISFIVLTFTLLWIAYSPLEVGTVDQAFKNVNITKPKSTNELKVLSWNTAFFYGNGSEGENYHKETKEYFLQQIDQAIELINSLQPDIVLFQEIDFKSSRSHNIDQLKYIAERTKLNNRAYAKSWIHNYIPFPYFPIRDHFKSMNSGGGILTRFEIKSNRVTLFEKPEEFPWWYNLLYLYRYLQKVEVIINGETYAVANTHLEAFKKKTRQEQAESIKNYFIKDNTPLIFAGDINAVHPNHNQEKLQDDYKDDKTYHTLVSIPDMKESLEDKNPGDENWFSFPAHKPDRRLDYIFFNEKKLSPIKSEIIENILSDHRPIYTIFKLKTI